MKAQHVTTPPVIKSEQSPRNQIGVSIDEGSKAHGRGRGHRLIRVPGRGYVVVRRASGRFGWGPLLIAGGIGAVAADFSIATVGRTAIIIGVVLFCFQRHREEQRAQFQRLLGSSAPANAAYDLGRDLGYEEGYQARREEERPVLVNLNARRGDAGAGAALSPTQGVVDRG